MAAVWAFAFWAAVFAALQVALAVFIAWRSPRRSRPKSAAVAASIMPVLWLLGLAVALVAALRQHPDIGFTPALVGNVLATVLVASLMWLCGFAIAWLTLRLARLPRPIPSQGV